MKKTDIISIVKYRDGEFYEKDDLMVNEIPISLYVNGDFHHEFFCSPDEIKELVIGDLYCRNIITSLSDIISVEIPPREQSAHVQVKRGFGEVSVPAIEDEVCFDIEALKKNEEEFCEASSLQKATGGVHRCALCDNIGTVMSAEDVSRHNAFYKVAGKALLNNISVRNKYIITSGRIPMDIMRKAAAVAIPMIVSRSAPTIAAVREAEKADITLIGFFRGNRFNVYTAIHRLCDRTIR